MPDISRTNVETIIRLCTIDGYCENFEGRLVISGTIDSDRVAKLLPIAHLITLDVERVLFHGDPEPVEDFYLDGRRNRHYYTVSNSKLYGELFTTGTDGGQPWTFVRPTTVGPPEMHTFDTWADIPKLMFPLLWKPEGRDS